MFHANMETIYCVNTDTTQRKHLCLLVSYQPEGGYEGVILKQALYPMLPWLLYPMLSWLLYPVVLSVLYSMVAWLRNCIPWQHGYGIVFHGSMATVLYPTVAWLRCYIPRQHGYGVISHGSMATVCTVNIINMSRGSMDTMCCGIKSISITTGTLCLQYYNHCVPC